MTEGVFYNCSFLLRVQKKRTKEKDNPNEASTRSEKNKKISKSSPPIGGNVNAFYDFLLFYSFTACAGPPFGCANALCFFETIKRNGRGRDIIRQRADKF